MDKELAFCRCRSCDMHFVVKILSFCLCFADQFWAVRFVRCADNAYSSALELVSFASGIKVKVLESAYKKWCADVNPVLFEQEEDDDFPEEMEEDELQAREEQEAEGSDCMKLLSCLQRETVFVDPDLEISTKDMEARDLEMENVVEGQQLKALVEKPEVLEPEQPEKTCSPKGHESHERMPTTVKEALAAKGDTFNALFRLAVRLRCAKGGVDTMFVKNARGCRRSSHKLNWHHHLGHYHQWIAYTSGIRMCCLEGIGQSHHVI